MYGVSLKFNVFNFSDFFLISNDRFVRAVFNVMKFFLFFKVTQWVEKWRHFAMCSYAGTTSKTHRVHHSGTSK